MILTPTTIVLGAGASMPYGMPSGAELRSLICRGTSWPETLHKMFAIDDEAAVEFITAFSRSNVASIDSFLSKRENFTQIGKLCIATILCSKEDQNSVTVNDIDDHWYHHLWQSMINDTQSPIDLQKNRVRFVTFNYDRSLEYFIHQAAKYTFGISDDAALNILNKIEILHVYGLLGEFHYKSTSGARPYSNDLNPTKIMTAAEGIRIIPEARADEKNFQTARNWFNESEVIGFLGFGFDSLNVKRLGLGEILTDRMEKNMTVPSVIASTLGKTEAETRKISQLLFPLSPNSVQAFSQKNTLAIRMSNLLG